MDIYEEVTRLRKEGRPCVVATIVQSSGSSPRKEGTKMLVRDDGSTMGTLGGGKVELEVIDLSVQAIREGTVRTASFDMSGRDGEMVCGGKLLVLIEPVLPDPHLVIVGAGHVGRALCTVAAFAGFRVTVVDDRAEYANAGALPEADRVVVNELADPFGGIPIDRETFVLIATRGHDHDLDALKAALGTQANYIGLVGSGHKKAVLLGSLSRAGFSEADCARVITPVGLPIGSVTPEEIAVSITAQIVQQRRKHDISGLGAASCGGDVQEDGAA